jgi:mono/diheme cytochrome c family protein
MRKRGLLLAIVTGVVACFGTAVFESSALGKTVAGGHEESASSGPTAVAGESWLHHLHRSFDETSMGKTGRLGPSSALPAAEFVRWQMGMAAETANETVTLDGSDLYRMNCRGCHGEDGMGAAPEINSLINPVRATSAATVMERMKTAGMDMSRTDAAKLAQQSKGMLLDRLRHGGQDMPAFPHLRGAEVDSLVAYLRQLAGVRGAEREQTAVRVPRVRVGEYIVKSTCHVCHSASGPSPNPQQLYEGVIPPLNTLALQTSRAEFVRKVTHGAPVLMGAPPEIYRGRMPVFYYLSEEEAADVYLYLTRYPPYQWATLNASSTAVAAQPDSTALDPGPQVVGASFSANGGPAEVRRTADTDTKFGILAALASCIAVALMGVGFGYTVCQLRRLSARNEGRNRIADRTNSENQLGAEEYDRHTNERAGRELVA